MRHERDRKKARSHDWHKADIKAELEKKGWTLRRLSIHCGYEASVLRNALDRPYPAAEALIAAAIGEPPHVIWPSRYDAEGKSIAKRRRGHRKSLNNTLARRGCD